MAKRQKNLFRGRIIRSYVTSVISISLVLVLVASAAILALSAGSVARYFKENMAVSVLLKQSTREDEGRRFSEQLAEKEFVKESRFISKEEGAEEMKALLGDDFLSVFESSPIPISIDLRLDGDYVTKDSINVIKSSLLENSLVDEVVYQETLVETLNENLGRIGLILGIVILLLLLISFALINNTVRLNIYARRFTIHTMSLVGAVRSFIARPFLRRAAIQGLVAGVLASGSLLAVILYFTRDSELLGQLLDMRMVYGVLAGTVLLGILICILSTLLVVNKVAYIDKDDLYY